MPRPRGAKRKGKDAKLARADILTGMYETGTHRLIPTDTCAIENETAKKVTLAIRDIMARWNMEPYNEDTGAGFVRHAVVRVGHKSGEVLVTVVTNGEEFPASKAFCRELARRVPEVTTIVQNVNTRRPMTLGRQGARALRPRIHLGHAVRTHVPHLVAVVLPGERHADRGALRRGHPLGGILRASRPLSTPIAAQAPLGWWPASRGAARVTASIPWRRPFRDAANNAATTVWKTPSSWRRTPPLS